MKGPLRAPARGTFVKHKSDHGTFSRLKSLVSSQGLIMRSGVLLGGQQGPAPSDPSLPQLLLLGPCVPSQPHRPLSAAYIGSFLPRELCCSVPAAWCLSPRIFSCRLLPDIRPKCYLLGNVFPDAHLSFPTSLLLSSFKGLSAISHHILQPFVALLSL